MYQQGRSKQAVRFSLELGGYARRVCVAGDFSNWEPVAMRRRNDGLFVRHVSGIRGEFEYKFIVDGQWITDPDTSAWSVSDTGALNSVGRTPR